MSDVPSDGLLPTTPSHSGTFALVDTLSGRVYPLQIGSNSIGRALGCGVVLADHAVSRHHALLVIRESGECEVTDTSLGTGVRIRGQRIRGVSALAPGDTLQICDFRLLFTRTDTAQLIFPDETLGAVVWNASDTCWHLTVPLAPDYLVSATYTPTDPTPPDADPVWDSVRACFRWVCSSEPVAQEFIVERLDRRERASPLYLRHVLFTPESATLIYCGYHGTVLVTVDRMGRFLSGPARIESGWDSGE